MGFSVICKNDTVLVERFDMGNQLIQKTQERGMDDGTVAGNFWQIKTRVSGIYGIIYDMRIWQNEGS